MGMLLILILIRMMYWYSEKFLSVGSNFLLIIAHPDDETMFFMPTLTWIRQKPAMMLSLLCLSNGDYEGFGRQRENELLECAKLHLGIPPSMVTIVDDCMIQDGWKHWESKALVPYIKRAVMKYDPDVILTFDEYGLGHPNHVSVYNGVCLYLREINGSGIKPIAYALKSVNIIRKYASILDVMGHISETNLVLTKNPLATIQSLMVHETQLTWFRILYCVFSSYVWFNSFKMIRV